MSALETPAATLAESAPATLPELSTLSPEQRKTWRTTGDLPKKQDSAPATKAEPDSAPEKPAAASESATEPPQKPHLKTKEDTEKRFSQLLEDKKVLERRLEALEKSRETKQAPQPAQETYKPLDEKEYFAANPKATYEDWVRAAAKHEAKWEARQEIALDNQRRAQAEAQKELASKVEEAKTRYPDFEQRIRPAVSTIMDDQQVPFPIKATINDSPVFVDLMYVLSDPKALEDLIATSKSNPTAALRKIFLTEQLVQAELAKPKAKSEEEEEEKPKASAHPITKAPKPPSEVGGRETALADSEGSAVKANDFRSFKTEASRRYIDRHK